MLRTDFATPKADLSLPAKSALVDPFGRAIRYLRVSALGAPVSAQAQAVTPDETCTTVRQAFIGLNNIAKKGNTKIVPFSDGYMKAQRTQHIIKVVASAPRPTRTVTPSISTSIVPAPGSALHRGALP
jgi:hypothetical protein